MYIRLPIDVREVTYPDICQHEAFVRYRRWGTPRPGNLSMTMLSTEKNVGYSSDAPR